MEYELLTGHEGNLYMPAVSGDVQWTTERKGTPSKLTFNVIDDGDLPIEEGDPVRFRADDADVFYGFVFTLKRTKSSEVSVTAYDQLRYLKNKDSYVFEGKSATDIVRMIAEDFSLNLGLMDEASYVIPSRVEENSTLFDMIQNALDLELQNSGRLMVLYDDFGKISLRDIENMKAGVLIDHETAEDFDYQSSIDSDTYNQIKLFRNNEEAGTREIYMARSGENINQWGVLQYYESLNEGENGEAKADALLKLYNQKTRTLKVSNAFGDVRCRAGVLLPVMLSSGDLEISNYMLVEKAVHTFQKDDCRMTLTLRGGLINGQ